jgi:hypothetical protein
MKNVFLLAMQNQCFNSLCGNQELFGMKLPKFSLNFVDSCIKDGDQALYHVEQISVASSFFKIIRPNWPNTFATEKQCMLEEKVKIVLKFSPFLENSDSIWKTMCSAAQFFLGLHFSLYDRISAGWRHWNNLKSDNRKRIGSHAGAEGRTSPPNTGPAPCSQVVTSKDLVSI